MVNVQFGVALVMKTSMANVTVFTPGGMRRTTRILMAAEGLWMGRGGIVTR